MGNCCSLRNKKENLLDISKNVPKKQKSRLINKNIKKNLNNKKIFFDNLQTCQPCS